MKKRLRLALLLKPYILFTPFSGCTRVKFGHLFLQLGGFFTEMCFRKKSRFAEFYPKKFYSISHWNLNLKISFHCSHHFNKVSQLLGLAFYESLKGKFSSSSKF